MDSVFTVLNKQNIIHHYDSTEYEVYEVFSMEENLYGYYYFSKGDQTLQSYKSIEPHYINGKTEFQNIKKNRRRLTRMLNNNQRFKCEMKDDNYVEEISTFVDSGAKVKIVVNIPFEENKIITEVTKEVTGQNIAIAE